MIKVCACEMRGRWSAPPHRRELKVLLSPALQEVSEDLSIGMVTIPPGESGDVHAHLHEQEVWYGLKGKLTVRVGDEEAELTPDTIIVAPAGVVHQILNAGKEEARALFIFSPAGPEREHLVDGDTAPAMVDGYATLSKAGSN